MKDITWIKKVEAVQFLDIDVYTTALSEMIEKDISIDYADPKNPILKFTAQNGENLIIEQITAKVTDWVVKENNKFYVFSDEYFIKNFKIEAKSLEESK